MNKQMMNRLQAVLVERAQRETATYSFFRQTLDDDGRPDGFFLIETSEHMTFEAFFELVEARPETAFVPLDPMGNDEERVAYWEELEAAAPTLEDMMEENTWLGTPEELWAKREQREAARPLTSEEVERKRKADRYVKSLLCWSGFLDLMSARVEANRKRLRR